MRNSEKIIEEDFNLLDESYPQHKQYYGLKQNVVA